MRDTERAVRIYLQVVESARKAALATWKGLQAGGRADLPRVPVRSSWLGQAFLSMVLKNHSVNLRSWAVAVCDSSCSRMLSCLRCWTSACSTALSCFSCGFQKSCYRAPPTERVVRAPFRLNPRDSPAWALPLTQGQDGAAM